MDERSVKEGDKPFRELFFRKKWLFVVVALVLFVGAVTAVTGLKVSGKPSFCATCHIIKPYYQSWEAGPLLAAKHGDKNVTCLDCHQQSIPGKMREGFNYVTGNYENPLKERDFSKEACLKCHQGDWEKTVAVTNFEASNPHDSHLGEMDCNLCHKMHRQSEVYCAQCHDFDWFKKLDGGWKVEAK